MKRWMVALALVAMVLSPSAQAENPVKVGPGLEAATFAGGCFWCTEAMFQQLKGVKSVTSGLMGGRDVGLTEQQISQGEGGAAEVIFLCYDPKEISYAELLEAFFAAHDPTSINKQGEDVGEEYRSVIFTYGTKQQTMATEAIAQLTKEAIYPNPIVTEVTPATKFYVAAEKHQDYYTKNSDPRYCKMVITPKVEKFRKIFADKVKD